MPSNFTYGSGEFPLQGTTDFYLEVAKGNVPGHAFFIMRGHNADIDSAAGEDLWEAGGLWAPLSTAETMNITSTSANDDDGNTGAETVLIQGVDNDADGS